MTTTEIATALESKPKGSIFTLVVTRAGKVRKSYDGKPITKTSIMQGMTNVNYADRKPVREAVANEERDAPELPSHIEDTFMVSKTRFWKGKNGKEYFPVCLTGNKPQAQWYLDGEPVDLDTIKDHLLASEYAERKDKETTEDKGQALFIGVEVSNVTEVR